MKAIKLKCKLVKLPSENGLSTYQYSNFALNEHGSYDPSPKLQIENLPSELEYSMADALAQTGWHYYDTDGKRKKFPLAVSSCATSTLAILDGNKPADFKDAQFRFGNDVKLGDDTMLVANKDTELDSVKLSNKASVFITEPGQKLKHASISDSVIVNTTIFDSSIEHSVIKDSAVNDSHLLNREATRDGFDGLNDHRKRQCRNADETQREKQRIQEQERKRQNSIIKAYEDFNL